MSRPENILARVLPEIGESRSHSAAASAVAGPTALPGSLPEATIPPRVLTGSDEEMRVDGHSEICISLSRRGAICSCDCRVSSPSDPAELIGEIIRFVRRNRPGIRALPARLTASLLRRLEEGDPSCRIVANWLVANGIRDARIQRSIASLDH